jgi:hypothetical protein
MHLSSRRSTTLLLVALTRVDQAPQSLVGCQVDRLGKFDSERFRNPELFPLPTLASIRHCPVDLLLERYSHLIAVL